MRAVYLSLMALAVLAASPAPAQHVGILSPQSRAHTPPVTSLVRAAERGKSSAQVELGFRYQLGIGVPQNYELAANWYLRAAGQGHPRAQHLLGLLFDRGLGVERDHVEALMWLNLAAAAVRGQRDRENYMRIRDAVATKLSLDEIAEAQLRASTWYPRYERYTGLRR